MELSVHSLPCFLRMWTLKSIVLDCYLPWCSTAFSHRWIMRSQDGSNMGELCRARGAVGIGYPTKKRHFLNRTRLWKHTEDEVNQRHPPAQKHFIPWHVTFSTFSHLLGPMHGSMGRLQLYPLLLSLSFTKRPEGCDLLKVTSFLKCEGEGFTNPH